MFFKYIKSKIKQPDKDLINALTDYFKFSEREAKEVLSFLDKKYVVEILQSLGTEDKEIKKLVKV